MTGCAARIVMWSLLILLPLGIYGDWLTYEPPPPFELPGKLIYLTGPLLLIGVMFSFIFYANPSAFFWLWATGAIVSAFIWRNIRIGWIERIVSFVLLIVLMSSPYLVPLMYGSYTRLEHQAYFEAYLGKDSGKKLNWLTEPEGALGGAIRRAQFKLDIYGCIYRLRGWSEDNKLYYDTGGSNIVGIRTCEAQVWEYDPESGGGPRRTWWLPGDFVPASEIVAGPPIEEKENAAAGGGVVAWPKRIVEESTSPDGTMRAAVIQDWSVLQYEVVVMEPVK